MSSVKTNYIFNTINTLSGMLFPLITFPYVARVLMPEGIGIVNFYNSIIGYITLFCSLGIPLYALRQVARVREDRSLRTKLAIELLSLNVFFVIIGYIIVAVLCITVNQIIEHRILFILMSSNILFVAIGCEWFYQGIEDFRYITIRGLIVKIICVILLFVLVRDKNDLIYYGLYSVVGVVGGNVFNFIRLKKHLDIQNVSLTDLRPFTHIPGVFKIFLLTIIGSIYLQLDSVMLGFLSGNTSVGYYTGAIRLTKLLLGIVTSLGLVLLPRLSSLYGKNNTEFNNLIIKSYDFIIMLALPISIGLLLLSQPLVEIFCGKAYIPSISPLQILSPIIFFIGLSYIAAQSNFARGKENITIYVGIVGAVTDLILNFILIPKYSAVGVAIATSITEGTILLIYMVMNFHQHHCMPFSIKHLSNCIISCLIMSIILLLLKDICTSDILEIILLPIIGGISYALSLLLLNDSTYLSAFHTILTKIRGNTNAKD